MELLLPSLSLVLITLLSLAFIILWILALVDILRSNFPDNTVKLIWVLVVFFFPLLGAVLYFAIGRKQKQPQVN
ncbi:MAG TPA: PLD nuclease N-terminal domain-containing protein [Flavisolibacter sp.]